MVTYLFYVLISGGLISGIYGFYLTLKVLEVSERKKESGYTFFILSGWWPLYKGVVPEKYSHLIFHGRVTLITTAIFFGVAMAIASTSNEI